ncbi:hypothetical protein TanjilG_27742 [Lupinus angustifolius]|uniref:Uncharacterized protein n=1 Tax=Lupinus angustifolius TaxID=3871 RepID=A0A4P1RHM4_LUPAN|nr:hypothetical protein TanjilG_27742 [Lupinus angustifolius]
MEGSLFDFCRPEPSQEPMVATPPLDMKQAESSQQHVRALNTHFASWVQTQLKNHPDELWEDGLRDYFDHASIIMAEAYATIFDWLLNFLVLILGNQSSTPSNHDASDDVDGENDLERPSSPSVKKSEEKGIVIVHEVKCKLYIKSSDPEDKDAWKDKGMGQLSIKCKEGIPKATEESKPTIIVRNESSDSEDKDAWKDKGMGQLSIKCKEGIPKAIKESKPTIIVRNEGNAGGSGGNDSVVASTFLI